MARSLAPTPRPASATWPAYSCRGRGGAIKQIAGDVAKERRDGAAFVLVTLVLHGCKRRCKKPASSPMCRANWGARRAGQRLACPGVIGEGRHAKEDRLPALTCTSSLDTELFG